MDVQVLQFMWVVNIKKACLDFSCGIWNLVLTVSIYLRLSWGILMTMECCMICSNSKFLYKLLMLFLIIFHSTCFWIVCIQSSEAIFSIDFYSRTKRFSWWRSPKDDKFSCGHGFPAYAFWWYKSWMCLLHWKGYKCRGACVVVTDLT